MFTRAKLTEIAPLLHVDAEEIARKLRNRGFEVVSTSQSLSEIAKASGRPEKEVMKVMGDDLGSQRAAR
jgi:hypothetical protein